MATHHLMLTFSDCECACSANVIVARAVSAVSGNRDVHRHNLAPGTPIKPHVA